MKALAELFDLSLASGAVFVAALSAMIAWALCYIRSKVARWIGAAFAPFVLSYCLYRSPVWLGANPDEYSSWALLFIGSWFLAGIIPSAGIVFVGGRRRAKRDG